MDYNQTIQYIIKIISEFTLFYFNKNLFDKKNQWNIKKSLFMNVHL